MKLLIGTLALALACVAAQADPLPQTERVMMRSPDNLGKLPPVDHLVVHKADRKMFLMHGDTLVRSYKILLGLNPVGTKERSGDFRTPEGNYRLIRRNPRSDFFLSMQVSYPNADDLKHDPSYYENIDWTDGCIAVSNADMLEIWLLTPDNAPIEILP
jgi:murein L,D-transpeptidase YafK